MFTNWIARAEEWSVQVVGGWLTCHVRRVLDASGEGSAYRLQVSAMHRRTAVCVARCTRNDVCA
jgi:hypothetical protein